MAVIKWNIQCSKSSGFLYGSANLKSFWQECLGRCLGCFLIAVLSAVSISGVAAHLQLTCMLSVSQRGLKSGLYTMYWGTFSWLGFSSSGLCDWDSILQARSLQITSVNQQISFRKYIYSTSLNRTWKEPISYYVLKMHDLAG